MSPPPQAHPQRREADLSFRLPGLVERFAGQRVAVIGDVIADEFVYGDPARISREAPVLILDHDRTTVVPGGAGNAASNAGALGGDVRLVGLVGPGDRELMDALRARVGTSHVLRPEGYRAPVKTRVLAGGLHTARSRSSASIAERPEIRPPRPPTSSARRSTPWATATRRSSRTTAPAS